MKDLKAYINTGVTSAISKNDLVQKFKNEIQVVRTFEEKEIVKNKFKRVSTKAAEPIPEKPKGPAQRPKMIMCYICGREYGSMSLPIHIKTCTKKWENEQKSLPEA